MAFTATWNATYELNPTAKSSPAQGDDQLRALKKNTRERIAVEHEFSAVTDETGRQGIHKAGSAIPFIQGTEPLLRPDGSAFEVGYDEGRTWIDTSKGGKLMYLAEVDDVSFAPTWKPLLTESIGKVTAFVSPPAVEDRWLLCDGRLITDSEVGEDGTEDAYASLVAKLHAEAAGDATHPYYASAAGTSAYIPDIRGRGIRGIEDGTNTADKDARGTELNDHEGIRKSGAYQKSAVLDHDHLIDHTHGAAIVDGHDTGAGRTGDPSSWTTGTPTFDADEKATWKISSWLTALGILTHRVPNKTDTVAGVGGEEVAEDSNVTTDLNHYHKVARFFGLSRKVSVLDADLTHGVPEREYETATDDNPMANVALYWYIKY